MTPSQLDDIARDFWGPEPDDPPADEEEVPGYRDTTHWFTPPEELVEGPPSDEEAPE